MDILPIPRTNLPWLFTKECAQSLYVGRGSLISLGLLLPLIEGLSNFRASCYSISNVIMKWYYWKILRSLWSMVCGLWSLWYLFLPKTLSWCLASNSVWRPAWIFAWTHGNRGTHGSHSKECALETFLKAPVKILQMRLLIDQSTLYLHLNNLATECMTECYPRN